MCECHARHQTPRKGKIESCVNNARHRVPRKGKIDLYVCCAQHQAPRKGKIACVRCNIQHRAPHKGRSRACNATYNIKLYTNEDRVHAMQRTKSSSTHTKIACMQCNAVHEIKLYMTRNLPYAIRDIRVGWLQRLGISVIQKAVVE